LKSALRCSRVKPSPHRGVVDIHVSFYADWNTTTRELAAWSRAWQSHPQGQQCRDQALACVAAVPNPGQFAQLLAGGANPNGGSQRTGPVLGKLLRSKQTANVIDCLEQLQNSKIAIVYPDGDDVYEQLRSQDAMQAMEERGIRFPRPLQLQLAEVLVNDMPFNTELHSRISALTWWLDDKRLGQDMPARAALIDRWLRTLRTGPEKEYEQSVCTMWRALETPTLPDPPEDGSGDSWAHRWARSIFPVDMPPLIVDRLLDHGGALINARGLTALEVLDENIQSHSWGSDDGVEITRGRLMARVESQTLEGQVPEANMRGAQRARL
jgi:hypothetical protein